MKHYRIYTQETQEHDQCRRDYSDSEQITESVNNVCGRLKFGNERPHVEQLEF